MAWMQACRRSAATGKSPRPARVSPPPSGYRHDATLAETLPPAAALSQLRCGCSSCSGRPRQPAYFGREYQLWMDVCSNLCSNLTTCSMQHQKAYMQVGHETCVRCSSWKRCTDRPLLHFCKSNLRTTAASRAARTAAATPQMPCSCHDGLATSIITAASASKPHTSATHLAVWRVRRLQMIIACLTTAEATLLLIT